MIHFDISQSPLFRIQIQGDVSRDQVRDFYKQFKPALDAAAPIGLLIDLTDFTDISAGAVLEDVFEELGLLDDLSKMPRVSVITSNRFIMGAVRYINPVVPYMHVNAYLPDDIAAAETWARELPKPKPDPKRPGLTLIPNDNPDVLAFEVDGYVDDDQMDTIVKPFQARLEQGGKFNTLARVKHIGGFDPELFFDKGLLGMQWHGKGAMHRYAVVTDLTWVKPFVGFARLISRVDVQLFKTQDEQAAWDWVNEPIPAPVAT